MWNYYFKNSILGIFWCLLVHNRFYERIIIHKNTEILLLPMPSKWLKNPGRMAHWNDWTPNWYTDLTILCSRGQLEKSQTEGKGSHWHTQVGSEFRNLQNHFSLKKPHRIPDLIGYQSLIIQSSLHCQEGCWIVSNRQFRLKASAVSTAEWSCIDIAVWKLAFPKCLLAPGLSQPAKALPF